MEANVYNIIFNVILYGGVLIFVGIFLLSFYKGYKSGEVEEKIEPQNTRRISRKETSMKNSINVQTKKICFECGTENELDAKFCKNCGNILKK